MADAQEGTPQAVAWGNGHVRHARVPEWLLDADVSDRAVRLYAVLARYADGNGVAWPGKEGLAKRLRCARSTLDAAMKDLERAEAVTIVPQWSEHGDPEPNRYVLHWAPGGSSEERGSSEEPGEGSSEEPEVNESNAERGEASSAVRGVSSSRVLEASPDAAAESEIDIQRIFDYWRLVRDKPERTKLTPKRREKIRARLREFSVADLDRAIDGVASDPWRDRRLHDDLTIIFRNAEQVEKFLALADHPPPRGPVTPDEAVVIAEREFARMRGGPS